MNAIARRVLVLAVCAAMLALLSLPAAGAQMRTLISADVAITWNANAVDAVRAFTRPSPAPPNSLLFQTEGLIYLSYVEAAVYDAVVKIAGRYVPYHDFAAGNTAGASLQAAVISATYNTLKRYLSPVEDKVIAGTTLTQKYDAAIAALPLAGRADGVAIGLAAANDIFNARANDGRNGVGTNCPYTPGSGTVAGVWEGVPPETGPTPAAQTPWVACMRPFLLNSANQFRVGAPPALTSMRYARDFNEVKAYGAKNSTVRTLDQTNTAYFWNANVINQYNDALRRVASTRGLDLVDAVRLFAMGNIVTADAGIGCFDAKYHYLFWRPFTAIRHADIDGNPATTADPNWLPLLNTPNHPEYPSAHGCVTSAFANAVANALHTKWINVDLMGATNGGTALAVTRHFNTVRQMTNEVVDARVWIGFHYRFSADTGVRLGTNVARWALARFFQPVRGHGHADEGDNDGDNGNNHDD